MVDGLKLGGRVTLKKQHPCGGDGWEILRLGADVKIQCLVCNRRIMLSRTEFVKRLKSSILTPRN